MPDTHERTNAPGFGHSSKADATLFTGTEAERGGGRRAASQHRGLHHDLRVLDVALALHHPQLQLRRAGLLPFPGLGCGAGGALARQQGQGCSRSPQLRQQPTPLLPTAPAATGQGQGDDGGHGEPNRSRTRGHAHRAVSRCCLPPSPLCPRPRHAEAHGLPTGTRRPPYGPPAPSPAGGTFRTRDGPLQNVVHG